jgi:hypothetical protein
VARDPQQASLELSAAEQPRTFRPVRTGKNFVLVVESRRVVARRWDKVEYQPGEKCEMTIVGERLGRGPLAVTVESEAEDGTWTAVARLQAEVAEAEDRAAVSWKLPEQPVVPGAASLRETDGSILTDAKFEDVRDLEEGGTVWMAARAPGLDGQSVQVWLEREDASGAWVAVGQATATVRSSAVRASVTPDAD